MSFATYPSLREAVVFITGGASGIGAEIVRAFAAQGSRVGFIDIDTERGGALAEELERQGATIRFASCDLRNVDALKRAFAALEAALGPATVLVNNAARDDRHDWQQVTPDYYDERIATNLRHMFFAIQAVAPGMIAAGKGSIINLGSNSWWEAAGGMPVYTSAKAAVHGMTRSFARPGAASHPGQHGGARLGHDRTAEDALGDARGDRAASPEAVPAGSDRAGLPRPYGAFSCVRRRRHVHGQQLHGGGGVDLRSGAGRQSYNRR